MIEEFEVVVIGSGPGGQKAAIQAAKAGRRVVIIEAQRSVGGACLHHGTVPSKTMREAALQIHRLRTHETLISSDLPEDVQVAHLMGKLDNTITAHTDMVEDQLGRNGVKRIHGRARFRNAHEVEVMHPGGSMRLVRGELYILATGSRPRHPANIDVDHELILDSDSILSLAHVPRRLTIIGGGIIACEYASIFALLGSKVTLLDRATRPLALLDEEFSEAFLEDLESWGGSYRPNTCVNSLQHAGLYEVDIHMEGQPTLRCDRVMIAAGRCANVEGLNISAAGVEHGDRYITVDEHCQTSVEHIYAVGDVIGPPALASTAMEQGRRAMCHALGLPQCPDPRLFPMAIYTVPEIAQVGIGEDEARAQDPDIVIGRAHFKEITRAQISGATSGHLKIIAAADGETILGVGVRGDCAAELIHVGQMAMLAKLRVQDFIENIFNFPTYAEAYRVAALDLRKQLSQRDTAAA